MGRRTVLARTLVRQIIPGYKVKKNSTDWHTCHKLVLGQSFRGWPVQRTLLQTGVNKMSKKVKVTQMNRKNFFF